MEFVVLWEIAAIGIFVSIAVGMGTAGLIVRMREKRRREAEARRREDDPLTTLQLQLRLGQMAREIRALAGDDTRFATAHHTRAAQSAYDELLLEACRRAGIEDDAPIASETDRLLRELELSSRGWTW